MRVPSRVYLRVTGVLLALGVCLASACTVDGSWTGYSVEVTGPTDRLVDIVWGVLRDYGLEPVESARGGVEAEFAYPAEGVFDAVEVSVSAVVVRNDFALVNVGGGAPWTVYRELLQAVLDRLGAGDFSYDPVGYPTVEPTQGEHPALTELRRRRAASAKSR